MINKLFFSSIFFALLFSCSTPEEQQAIGTKQEQMQRVEKLTLVQANRLIDLPLSCMQQEFPNKLGQSLNNEEEIGTPTELHPAFYGCFDWHSSVHGHWSLVKLLKDYPTMERADEARRKLAENITAENINAEVLYFESDKHYERTYGWAWLLKLAEELHTWDDPLAKELEQNLQPLTDLIVEKYIDFLPKLVYPIRVGEHSNTAFGLSFAWDYASTTQHETLKNLIEKRAREFYFKDAGCPISWEPSGYDFLSPCLEEIDIMRRVLPEMEFRGWIKQFLPSLLSTTFKLEVGEVGDRTDGKLVHLDGLNLSRAWVLYGLVNQYPEYSSLNRTANQHITYSLPNLVGDSYEGGHWLASFAIYALSQQTEK